MNFKELHKNCKEALEKYIVWCYGIYLNDYLLEVYEDRIEICDDSPENLEMFELKQNRNMYDFFDECGIYLSLKKICDGFQFTVNIDDMKMETPFIEKDRVGAESVMFMGAFNILEKRICNLQTTDG